MRIELVGGHSKHLLHVLAHLEEHDVIRLVEALVSVDSPEILVLVDLRQEYRVWLALRDHILKWLCIIRLGKIVEVRRLEVGDVVVDVRKDARHSRRRHQVLASVLLRYSLQVLIVAGRVVRRYQILIDLGVGWQSIEVLKQIWIHFSDLACRKNPRILC